MFDWGNSKTDNERDLRWITSCGNSRTKPNNSTERKRNTVDFGFEVGCKY